MKRIVLPGATIGVLGSGQLGRMFALEARRMGYRVHTLSPGVDTPTGQVADLEVSADYDDIEAIRTLARSVDVMTFEFENVPVDTVRFLSGGPPHRAPRCAPHARELPPCPSCQGSVTSASLSSAPAPAAPASWNASAPQRPNCCAPESG